MNGSTAFLEELDRLIASRKGAAPESGYTASLLAAGRHRIAQKVGEEGVELALAGVGEDRAQLVGEAADLLYHMLVLLAAHDSGLAEVVEELERRHRRTPPVRE